MAQTSNGRAQARFSHPVRQIVFMLVVLGLTGVGAWLLYPAVSGVFLANPWLNGIIGLVFVVGVMACFWQVIQLVISVGWIEDFVARRPGHEFTRAPRLLGSLAALLRERRARMSLSASSSRSILDSVAARIDEARDITRYIVNLLIFLGLLGTFYGLATTVPAVVDTIRSLAPHEGQTGVEVFESLMTGLEAQLGGMGTAFSSSLLGLAGSLVVGMLELFAGHGQNRFYRELEEWLSGVTRLSLGAVDADGQVDQVAVAGILAQVVDRLERLEERDQMVGTETLRGLDALAEAVAGLIAREAADRQRAEALLGRIAEGQQAVAAALQEGASAGNMERAHEAENRMRLRSIDTQLQRIFQELAEGRQQSTADLRADIAALTTAVRLLARNQV
ncbi:MAG: biopolymer transporter ExbB [Alphaproteobacteria bacterium]|nr:biopolymer transporter ExbB [Alphaproteobacteria bacterium]